MTLALFGGMTNAQLTAEIQILSLGERVPRDPRDAAAVCRTLSRSAELCGPKTRRRVMAIVEAHRAWIAAQTV